MTVRPIPGPPHGLDHRPGGYGVGRNAKGVPVLLAQRLDWSPFHAGRMRDFYAHEHELGPRVAAAIAGDVPHAPQHVTALCAARSVEWRRELEHARRAVEPLETGRLF